MRGVSGRALRKPHAAQRIQTMPSLDILVPVVMATALLWWVSRGLSWSRRLIAVAIALAVIVVIVLAERTGYWPDAFRR
jgi:hypothetical protein